MSAPAPIILNGMEVHARREMVNTTDLWRAAGSPSGRAPSDRLAPSSSKEFVACVEASLNAGNSGIRAKKGNGGSANLIARHVADVKGQGHLFSIASQADEPK
ncbi:MAG: hypothetical protein ABII76_21765 [Pseudomonadota bacterium]